MSSRRNRRFPKSPRRLLPAPSSMRDFVTLLPQWQFVPQPAPPAPEPAAPSPKLIGTGGYGCVYAPPIPCATPCADNRCQNGIAKLMSRSNAKDERKKLDSLPPTFDAMEQYSIRNPYMCKADINYINECKVVDPADKPTLLLYANGGPNIDECLVNGLWPAEYYIRGMANIIDGLVELHAIPAHHLDLKVQNIVSGVRGDQFRLIDFGFVLSGKQLMRPESRLSYVYLFWPIDVILASDYNVSSADIEAYVVKYIKKYGATMSQPDNILEQLMQFRRELRIVDIITKIDVYSLGFILKYEFIDLPYTARLVSFVDDMLMMATDPRHRPTMYMVQEAFYYTFSDVI